MDRQALLIGGRLVEKSPEPEDSRMAEVNEYVKNLTTPFGAVNVLSAD